MAILTTLLAATVPASGAKMSDEEIVQDLRVQMDRLAGKDAFSGAVLLAKGDKILFEQAYGFANHAFDARNSVETRFNLGSMGKMFTAVAILQLAQQGKLALDDKLIKLVPDYPDKDIAGEVTVHQLLTHTSGLGSFFNSKFFASSRAAYRTTQSHLPLFTGEPLLFAPGTRWSYSNSGFIVLGLIIERVSGQSYYDYVREHIFKTAGMLDTDNYNVDDDVPNLALGYTRLDDEGRPVAGSRRRTNILLHVGRGGAAGGGYSTVRDLLRFSRALQENRLLKAKYTELDMTGKVDTDRGTDRYAYGMIEAIVNSVRIVGHGGNFPGIDSQLDMYPELGYTVVVMSNYDGAGRPVVERLRLLLTGQELPRIIKLSVAALNSFAGRYSPSPPPNAPATMRLPPIEIVVDQDALLVNVGRGGPSHRFLPVAANEFFDESSPAAHLAFAGDGAGRIVSARLSGVGPIPIETVRLP